MLQSFACSCFQPVCVSMLGQVDKWGKNNNMSLFPLAGLRGKELAATCCGVCRSPFPRCDTGSYSPRCAGLRGEELAVAREVKFQLGSTLRGLGTSNLGEACSDYQVGKTGAANAACAYSGAWLALLFCIGCREEVGVGCALCGAAPVQAGG